MDTMTMSREPGSHLSPSYEELHVELVEVEQPGLQNLGPWIQAVRGVETGAVAAATGLSGLLETPI
jgi:hypothetical protein